jgi:spore germination protein YaaH
VLRSGATYKQTSATGVDVPLSNDRSYQFTVAAVDRHGRLSAQSGPVTMETGHVPPPAPANVIAGDISDSELTLSWAPSRPARGTIAGYRIYRDGRPLRQVATIATRITNLAAASSHVFTVAAVDSSGWLSPQSAPATISTAPPIRSTGKAQAFLLATTDRSFADLRAHYTQIGVVYPTYFDCTPTADIADRPNAQITTWAQQRGVKVLPRMNCQNSAVIDRILNDPATRSQWLDRIAGLVQRDGYDGISIDFEAGYASDRAAYTSFITELAARLHAAGRLLTVAASAKTADVPNHPRSTFFDYAALSQQADWIFVMGWGVHWMTSAPGSQDDIAWLRGVVGYVATMPQRGRFVLGTQLYGMDWPNGGGTANPATSYEFGDVQARIAQMGGSPVRDGATDSWHYAYQDDRGNAHDLWFQDAATLSDRLRLARDNGLGVGFWRLGNEDQRLWDDPLLQPGG